MISIIIPTLNEESIIEPTLKNLRRLSKLPLEIIISEGRSTDRTVALAEPYADKIVVYKGTERQTIASGRNLGALAASGEFYVFIDADVLIPEPDEFFAKAFHIFSQDEKLMAITVKLRVMPQYERFGDRFWFGFINCTSFLNNNIFHKGTAPGDFQMMRATAFRAVGGFNEKLVASEDFDMFRKLSLIGKTRYIPSLMIYHTGRRAHKVGWMRLISEWFMNWLWVLLFKKAASKEWKVIR